MVYILTINDKPVASFSNTTSTPVTATDVMQAKWFETEAEAIKWANLYLIAYKWEVSKLY